jgi:hypothetical protein
MNKIAIISLAVFAGIIWCSCSKKDEMNSGNNNKSKTGSLQFSLSMQGGTLYKSSKADTLASYLIVSIIDTSGKSIAEFKKIELINFDGNYLSKPIVLSLGSYKLTFVAVVDSTGKVIYASPKLGSDMAIYVLTPLEIEFTIKDSITVLNPEVISAKKHKPSEFGYIDNSFWTIKTFDFKIAVYTYNDLTQSNDLTSATLKVTDGTDELYAFQLESNTNLITVDDEYKSFGLIVLKDGYVTFSITLSSDSLKKCFYNPISVILKSGNQGDGLVAYYPFNSNANDESGNGNDGTVYGASLTNDRFGNQNKAYQFDGSSNYIEIIPKTQITDLSEFTIAVWIKIDEWDTLYRDRERMKTQYIFDAHGDKYGSPLYQPGPCFVLDYTKTYAEDVNCYVLYNYSGSYIGHYSEQRYAHTIRGSWHHLVYVRKATVTSLYFDGVKSTNLVYNIGENVSGISDITHPWYIGVFAGGSSSDNFFYKGVIDELYFYNRALSESEIEKLHDLK